MNKNPSETKRLADAVASIAATIVEIINEKLKAATTAQPGSVPLMATTTATTTAKVPEGWIRKKELAQHLKVSLRTIDNWIGKGMIPYIRLGSRMILFKQSLVDESLNRRFQRNGLW